MCVHHQLFCTCWGLSFVCLVICKVAADQWLTHDLLVPALLSHCFYGFCFMFFIAPIMYKIGFNDVGHHHARRLAVGVANELADIDRMYNFLATNSDSDSDSDAGSDDHSDSESEDDGVSTEFGERNNEG